MSLLIGMDEAGLGPNLGPFVVAATVWEVPGPPDRFDFWTAFDTILTSSPESNDPRLHIADSKQVFQPHRGLSALERGVWTAFKLCGLQQDTFQRLCQALLEPLNSHSTDSVDLKAKDKSESGEHTSRGSLFNDVELIAARCPSDTSRVAEDELLLPWYSANGFRLPIEPGDFCLAEPWQRLCDHLNVRLIAIRADVVEPLRFNRLVRRYDNKSQATSRLAMNLLRSVWDPHGDDTLIVADKHGGRNRYDGLLAETFELPVECLAEGADQSVYRMGRGELRFQPRAESHGPVALASMTAKYLRELAMHQFNRFWQARIPDLKPTQGYPTDAVRFRGDVNKERRQLQISDDIFWRER